MNKQLFKFIKLEDLENEPILAIIGEEHVQSLVKSNLGRKMTDKELLRFTTTFWEAAYDGLVGAILGGAEAAMTVEPQKTDKQVKSRY